MTTHRNALPQLGDTVFLTDGGLETVLIFHHGMDLPQFAAIDLLRSDEGTTTLRDYYRHYAGIAVETGLGFILESPSWRASRDWADKLGYGSAELTDLNYKSIALMEQIRDELATDASPMVISGNIGPRGDGYVTGELMSADQARAYHEEQIRIFADTCADMVSGLTVNYVNEAIGIVQAANDHAIPSVISFTTETDGRLPDGSGLGEAILAVDDATDGGPAYYAINCAHVEHFRGVLDSGNDWMSRIRGVRANASRLSHAELDEAEELDDGDPDEFGHHYGELRAQFPNITVLGGCCGTDHRHVRAAAEAAKR